MRLENRPNISVCHELYSCKGGSDLIRVMRIIVNNLYAIIKCSFELLSSVSTLGQGQTGSDSLGAGAGSGTRSDRRKRIGDIVCAGNMKPDLISKFSVYDQVVGCLTVIIIYDIIGIIVGP